MFCCLTEILWAWTMYVLYHPFLMGRKCLHFKYITNASTVSESSHFYKWNNLNLKCETGWGSLWFINLTHVGDFDSSLMLWNVIEFQLENQHHNILPRICYHNHYCVWKESGLFKTNISSLCLEWSTAVERREGERRWRRRSEWFGRLSEKDAAGWMTRLRWCKYAPD